MKNLILIFTFITTLKMSSQCVSGGTIFATFTSTANITQPPPFVILLDYEICSPGLVTDTSGGNANRTYYIGGGELIFKAFKNSFIALKSGAKLTVLGGSNFINIMHEPGVTIIGATSSSITPCSPISFPSPNSCGSVGVNEIEVNTQIQIYPNPFNTKITIFRNSVEKTEIKLFNLLGELLFETSVEGKQSETDLSVLPKGLYFLRIGNATKKIIKE